MTAMRDRVTIGQQWERRRDGLTIVVRQVRRQARLVEVKPAGQLGLGLEPRPLASRTVTFSDLRRRWRLID